MRASRVAAGSFSRACRSWTPEKRTRAVVGSLGSLSLAVDVAVSPDRQKVALAVAGNSAAQGPSVVEQPVQTVTTSPPPSCGTMSTGVRPPSRRARWSPSPTRGGRAVRADARARRALARGHRRDDGPGVGLARRYRPLHLSRQRGRRARLRLVPPGGWRGRARLELRLRGGAPDAVDPRRASATRRRSTGTEASMTSRP